MIYCLMDRYIQFIDDDNVDGYNSNDIDNRWKLLLTQIKQEERLTMKPIWILRIFLHSELYKKQKR